MKELIIGIMLSVQGMAQQAPVKDTVKPLPVPHLSTLFLSPRHHYQSQFGFFCRKEWKLEQRIGIPVKVRLGNYTQTQQKEGH